MAVRTVDKRKGGEIGQQAQTQFQPNAIQVQGRHKVTAEGMLSREQRLETP